MGERCALGGEAVVRIHVAVAVLMLTLAVGCAALEMPEAVRSKPPIYPPDHYSHRVGGHPIVLYWNCARPESGVLRFEGVAHNPSAPEVRFVELELVGVDARDRDVSQAAVALPDILLHTNQISPFQLDLRLAGTEVRFDLFYQYWFQENGDRLLPASPAGGQALLARQQRFMARDVCSETQHRVR